MQRFHDTMTGWAERMHPAPRVADVGMAPRIVPRVADVGMGPRTPSVAPRVADVGMAPRPSPMQSYGMNFLARR